MAELVVLLGEKKQSGCSWLLKDVKLYNILPAVAVIDVKWP
jgi:hypothetical protein